MISNECWHVNWKSFINALTLKVPQTTGVAPQDFTIILWNTFVFNVLIAKNKSKKAFTSK